MIKTQKHMNVEYTMNAWKDKDGESQANTDKRKRTEGLPRIDPRHKREEPSHQPKPTRKANTYTSRLQKHILLKHTPQASPHRNPRRSNFELVRKTQNPTSKHNESQFMWVSSRPRSQHGGVFDLKEQIKNLIRQERLNYLTIKNKQISQTRNRIVELRNNLMNNNP